MLGSQITHFWGQTGIKRLHNRQFCLFLSCYMPRLYITGTIRQKVDISTVLTCTGALAGWCSARALTENTGKFPVSLKSKSSGQFLLRLLERGQQKLPASCQATKITCSSKFKSFTDFAQSNLLFLKVTAGASSATSCNSYF